MFALLLLLLVMCRQLCITSREKTTCGYSCEIFAMISKHSLRKFCHSVRHYTNNVDTNISAFSTVYVPTQIQHFYFYSTNILQLV